MILILVIWLAVERPTIKYVFDFNSGIIQCGGNPYTGLSIALGYNAILLLITLFFAFLTRKVPENVNETKFISLTTFSLVDCFYSHLLWNNYTGPYISY